MKKNIIVIGLLIAVTAGLFIITNQKASADNPQRLGPAFVEIKYHGYEGRPSVVSSITACGDELPELALGMNLAEAAVALSKAGLIPEQPVVFGQRVWRR